MTVPAKTPTRRTLATEPTPSHVHIQALGEDRWRLQCRRARCPADMTKVTSPGGARQFAVLHRALDPDGLVAAALAEMRR